MKNSTHRLFDNNTFTATSNEITLFILLVYLYMYIYSNRIIDKNDKKYKLRVTLEELGGTSGCKIFRTSLFQTIYP